MVKAKSFFDFIEVTLYEEQRYKLRDMRYWYWSEKNQEFQEHHTCEGLTWDYISEFVEQGLIFIK